MPEEVEEHIIKVTDNRTGETYDLPVDGEDKLEGSVDAKFFKEKLGLSCYDPGYLNTAVCRSAITFIDGEVSSHSLTRIAKERNTPTSWLLYRRAG